MTSRIVGRPRGLKLSLNDMSLPRGGLFDLYANPRVRPPRPSNVWKTPHLYHRHGTSVDVNRRYSIDAATGAAVSLHPDDIGVTRAIVARRYVRLACRAAGGHLVKESTLHCEFDPRNK